MSDISAIAVLDDPVRRRLYDFVSGTGRAVGRDEAAAAAGIGRSLAAFHLDKLAGAGLLDVTHQRPPGRSGPGAGRPAKLYQRAEGERQVSVPPRDYRWAAETLAEVAEVTGAEPAVHRVARRRGEQAGRAARRAAPDADPAALALGCLAGQGFEPYQDEAGFRLRNCPFHLIAEQYPPLVCGMNLELVAGILAGTGAASLTARLDPGPGNCCVAIAHSKINDS